MSFTRAIMQNVRAKACWTSHGFGVEQGHPSPYFQRMNNKYIKGSFVKCLLNN